MSKPSLHLAIEERPSGTYGIFTLSGSGGTVKVIAGEDGFTIEGMNRLLRWTGLVEAIMAAPEVDSEQPVAPTN